MPKNMVKTCGVVVSGVMQSGLSYTPSNNHGQGGVENNSFYTSFLDSLLTGFDHIIGGHLRRYFQVFTLNPQHQ